MTEEQLADIEERADFSYDIHDLRDWVRDLILEVRRLQGELEAQPRGDME